MAAGDQPKREVKLGEPELHPDGWERFERAVDAAVKGGPKHKAAVSKEAARKRAGRQKAPDG